MRVTKKRTPTIIPSLAFIVDGETEAWYLNMLKRNERNIRISINPKIPSKKSIEEQYNSVVELLKKEHTRVFWIVDLDTLIKEEREASKGAKTSLEKFEECRVKLQKEYPNVIVIANNPCLEFWFLLHFERTSKYYDKCSEAESQLKNYLKGYEKKQDFFTKQNQDIYLKLRPSLEKAIEHSRELGNLKTDDMKRAISEMVKLFECEELKSHFIK